jgi:AcrR family transcriptional regulator
VRKIASEAGIGPSTLRHYYPTQGALHEALALRQLGTYLSDLRITDQSVPAAERLFECVAQFLPSKGAGVAPLESWITLQAEAYGLEVHQPIRDLFDALDKQGRARVGGWLDMLAREGALPKAATSDARAILLATVNGLCLAMVNSERLSLARSRSLLRQVVDALLAPQR